MSSTPESYGFNPFRPPIMSPYMPPGAHGRTSATEIIHLTIAYLAISLAFFFIWWDLTGQAVGTGALLWDLAFGFIAAGTAFVAHEMAHKISAQDRGLWAEFRMSPTGLLLCLVLAAVLGVLFASPGATMVAGRADPRTSGITSLAGPAMNLSEGSALGAGLFLALRLHPYWGNSPWVPLLEYAGYLNFAFAVFNLLPLGPLDGRKVFHWNKGIWGGAILLAIAGAVLAYLITFGYYSFA